MTTRLAEAIARLAQVLPVQHVATFFSRPSGPPAVRSWRPVS
jgi:hypothetical protein